MLNVPVHLKINQLLIRIYLLISCVCIYQGKLFYFLLVIFYLKRKLSIVIFFIFLLGKFAKVISNQCKIFNIITLIIQTTEISILFILIWTSLITFIWFQNSKSSLFPNISCRSFNNRHFDPIFFLAFY